jgi:hypothetical protein
MSDIEYENRNISTNKYIISIQYHSYGTSVTMRFLKT